MLITPESRWWVYGDLWVSSLFQCILETFVTKNIELSYTNKKGTWYPECVSRKYMGALEVMFSFFLRDQKSILPAIFLLWRIFHSWLNSRIPRSRWWMDYTDHFNFILQPTNTYWEISIHVPSLELSQTAPVLLASPTRGTAHSAEWFFLPAVASGGRQGARPHRLCFGKIKSAAQSE